MNSALPVLRTVRLWEFSNINCYRGFLRSCYFLLLLILLLLLLLLVVVVLLFLLLLLLLFLLFLLLLLFRPLPLDPPPSCRRLYFDAVLLWFTL